MCDTETIRATGEAGRESGPAEPVRCIALLGAFCREYWAWRSEETGEVFPATIRERPGDCDAALKKLPVKAASLRLVRVVVSCEDSDMSVEQRLAILRGAKVARRSGERNPAHKLTQAEVDEMRILIGQNYSERDLAAVYGVSCSTVHRAIKGETWKEAPNAKLIDDAP